jgi:hypothetical protein
MNAQTFGQTIVSQAELGRLLAEMVRAVRNGRVKEYGVYGDWFAEATEALRKAGIDL